MKGCYGLSSTYSWNGRISLSQFYSSPKGRVSRRDWWLKYFLVVLILTIVAEVLDKLGLAESDKGIGPIRIITWLVVLYPAIIVNIKRFHDRDKSGWWVLIGLIPIVGALWILIECGLLPGTVGDNRYGPDPERRLTA